MSKRSKSSSIRLIGGQWRGRRLPVLDAQGLRPTIDRVRETLFNWLMHRVSGARCLDLFAGTGALGFECLSRGAESVQFVEKNREVANVLLDNIELLNTVPRTFLSNQSAIDFLGGQVGEGYDLVFLDPPFQSDLLSQTIDLLVRQNWLNEGATIYIEQDSKMDLLTLPENWSLYRQGQAGQSAYFLYGC